MLVSVLWSLTFSSPDSLPMSQAQASLALGDTLGAIGILDDWSASHAAGPELSNLLGALHMPDEPAESLALPEEANASDSRAGRWRLRTDGGVLAASDLVWGLGATLVTRVGEMRVWGAPALVDLGVATVVWSEPGSIPAWGADPMLGLSLLAGPWDVRLDSWTGIFDRQWDAGFMATTSRAWADSSGRRRRMGLMVRGSLLATSFLGGFCQWDRERGKWLWEARVDLRLRHDPLATQQGVADSLLPTIRGARVQSLNRGFVLRRIGKWALGPTLELDARSSLGSDIWLDGQGRRSAVRRDGSIGAGGLARVSTGEGRWGEARLGWSQGFADSDIDPEYSARNSGLTTSIAAGLSF